MGEVIRLMTKSEHERARLIREARAIYNGIFPPADLDMEQRDKAPLIKKIDGANARDRDGVSS